MSRSARYPAFDTKAANSGEFAQVARDQSQVERKRVRCDQCVERPLYHIDVDEVIR